ncbi:YxD-tail cyclophane-containing RiPP peptide [Streptomyces inhibens]|uniref:YxD-tail cyclophane-containing RiPP peptide n=1 Tax=Streptomyces inhibens TaxID=2293571 RepID=UPI00402AC755
MDKQTFPEADRVSHDETVGPRGNDVPLRDYSGVDLQDLADHTTHPVLRDVLARLTARTGSPGDSVAYYEDSAGEPPTATRA